MVEFLGASGYSGPNVDLGQLQSRWERREAELKPEWIRTRNLTKLEVGLPGPIGTVDMNNITGRYSASIMPSLRALPSWDYAR